MSRVERKFKNKKICLLGFGIENQAFLGWLEKQGFECEVFVCNKREIEKRITNNAKRIKITRIIGKDYNKNLSKYDVILRAPGYPLFDKEIQKAKKAGKEISSAMKMFFEFSPSRNIVGVTGTKGKGTTSSLIAHILKKAGKKVFLGGNIGIAPFSFVHKIKKTDWVVLELSSFQLEDMTVSPRIAVITNFSREHLAPADPNNPNYHRSLKDYRLAKSNISRWQSENDYVIVGGKLEIGNWKLGKGRVLKFGKSELESKLVGEHNKKNIAAAETVAKVLRIRKDIVAQAVKSFKGLPHRIELIKKDKDNKFYNDTFATTPEASITAMKSFTESIILLAGGADKGSDFRAMAREIKRQVEFLVLFQGKGSERIKQDLAKQKYPKEKISIVKSMAEARQKIVAYQKKAEKKKRIILLSPGCASFGVFKNYKERGKEFVKYFG